MLALLILLEIELLPLSAREFMKNWRSECDFAESQGEAAVSEKHSK